MYIIILKFFKIQKNVNKHVVINRNGLAIGLPFTVVKLNPINSLLQDVIIHIAEWFDKTFGQQPGGRL